MKAEHIHHPTCDRATVTDSPNLRRDMNTSSMASGTTIRDANASNMANDSDPKDLGCPVFSQADDELDVKFAFWCEGIILCLVAVGGIVGNTISSFILVRRSMRNSFNLLLIALAIYDNTYLVGAILESFRKRFRLISDLHVYLFPYFLYPLHMIAMTGSILMTVAIALERYAAVHHPVSYYNTRTRSRIGGPDDGIYRRVAQYLVPVTVLSLIMNVTKFLEIEIVYDAYAVNVTNSDGQTSEELHFIPGLNITEFRMDPLYSIYFNWFRFITLGIIPFMLLVFFNTRIYLDIRYIYKATSIFFVFPSEFRCFVLRKSSSHLTQIGQTRDLQKTGKP